MNDSALKAIEKNKSEIAQIQKKSVAVPEALSLYCEDGMSYSVSDIIDELKRHSTVGLTSFAKEQLAIALAALTTYNDEVTALQNEAIEANNAVAEKVKKKREELDVLLNDVPEKKFTKVVRISKSKLSPEVREDLVKVYKKLGFTHVGAVEWRDFVFFDPAVTDGKELRNLIATTFEDIHPDKSFLTIRNYIMVENNTADLETVIKSLV